MDQGGPFWIDLTRERVETDDERGSRQQVLGPYPTRRAAENALVRIRARDADRRAREASTVWRPVRPPSRLELWGGRHRRALLGVAVTLWVVIAGGLVWGLVTHEDRAVDVTAPALINLVVVTLVVRGLRRATAAGGGGGGGGGVSGAASGAPPGRTPR